ncbi:DUF4132 domain-containing protein [Mucilaginibacter flavus]|uniref:DUF4132 domain-containing protein n=1 Tax=Mucilaginibacter flavus TaxID=931504 RepID=UPI0025B2B5B1|nr:DUF4132 domain-containing protein [Mucilaginibacter flavus]
MRITTFLKNIFAQEAAEQKPETTQDPIIEEAITQMSTMRYWYNVKANDVSIYQDKIVPLTDSEKIAFILRQVSNLIEWNWANGKKQYDEGISKRTHISKAFIDQLFRSKLDLIEQEVEQLTTAFIKNKVYDHGHLMDWPVKSLVGIIQKKYKNKPIPALVETSLSAIRTQLATTKSYTHEKASIKLVEQIDAMLFKGDEQLDERPVLFLGKDDFADYANKLLAELPAEGKPQWNKLMELCQKSGTATTPTQKFITTGKTIIDTVGPDKFIRLISDWFTFISRMKEKVVAKDYYQQLTFLEAVNVDCLKGFVWLSSIYSSNGLLQLIAAVADRCYRKVPGIGQTCTALGNACLFALFKSPGLDGISHLSRLKLRVKQANTQGIIEKYLTTAATERGVSVADIEDLAVDDFDLINGKIQQELEGFTAQITIEKVGKVNLVWQKADGTTQASDPAVVKEKQPATLKQLKATCKAIEASLSTQRDRFDQRFRSSAKISWDHFNINYFNHGLVSFISYKLIWRFEKPGDAFDAIYWNGSWQNHSGLSFSPGDGYEISLWHPALDTLENVKLWRAFFIKNELQQPLKQAFREIYLLTDAEMNTRSYSNRMAGHILKQHQFNSLAKGRGWRYSLQGAFDGGSNGSAQLNLLEHNLIAQYFTAIVDAEQGVTESGIYKYVATDQVRFKNAETNATINLVDVPIVVLSEVMRDTDLFVGVASVGNDPTWRDNGDLPGYHGYWQAYSFGDLSEVAKNRRETLERLLPRLKIAKVTELKDRFLIVKGKKRTYKIHLGSTNILMEPNDQYLCIVPDRSPKEVQTNIFLPFEGDNGLSIILSKAFLLADDDKIKDETITRQIDR